MYPKTLFFSLGLLVAFPTLWAAAPLPSEYAYEQKVQTPPLTKQASLKFSLDEFALSQIDKDFGNLQLLNNRNEETKFVIHDRPAQRVKALESIDVSSAKGNVSPLTLIDNDGLTQFKFDEKKDGIDPSWVLVDFGRPVLLHRVKVLNNFQSEIRGMALSGGIREGNLKTLRKKTAFQRFVDSEFRPVRFLKIEFWGVDIHIDDILFYTREEADIYFNGEAGQSYKVLYGNPSLDSKRYVHRISEPWHKLDREARLSKRKFNPLFETDYDKDGIPNEEDNCVFLANRSQKDSDTDGVGNVCDNAPKVKNTSQSDIDEDGVGDIIDNCRIDPNPDQKDRDDDGFGNRCDNAHAKEPSEGSGSGKIWLGIGILLLLSASIWYMTTRSGKGQA